VIKHSEDLLVNALTITQKSCFSFWSSRQSFLYSVSHITGAFITRQADPETGEILMLCPWPLHPSGLLWAFPVTISSQQKLSYSKTWERANCLSSSVWIKQAQQKLFAFNHIVRPFNNAWKCHPFSSSLGFWPAMLQVDLFSAIIELIYKDIVYSTLGDTWVSGERKSDLWSEKSWSEKVWYKSWLVSRLVSSLASWFVSRLLSRLVNRVLSRLVSRLVSRSVGKSVGK